MNLRQHLRQALISGLAYGFGLVAGNLLGIFIAANITLPRSQSEFNILLLGLASAFVITAGIGGIGGFSGGYTLPEAGKPHGRWGYAWQGAVSMALTYGSFLYATLLVVTLIAFYSVVESPPAQFALLFMWAGALFGALSGLLLGLLTVGWRRALYVVLAGLAGFGVGGLFLGLGGRAYLLSVSAGDRLTGELQFLLLGISLFGLFGGAALGFIYSYLMAKTPLPESAPRSRRRIIGLLVTAAFLLLISWLYMRPLLAQLNLIFTAHDPGLTPLLASDTVGTHWFATAPAAVGVEPPGQPSLAANGEQVALAWAEQSAEPGTIVIQNGVWQEKQQGAAWDDPLIIYEGSENTIAPGVALSADGGETHVVWRDGTQVFYRRCRDGLCDILFSLPDAPEAACRSTTAVVGGEAPAIAVNEDNVLQIVYHSADGSLRYAFAEAGDIPTILQTGCIAAEATHAAAQVQVTSGPEGRFVLALSHRPASDEIAIVEFDGENWADSAQNLGSGHSPDILIDGAGQVHAAWCDADGGIHYWLAGNSEQATTFPCLSRPEIAIDSEERPHIIWAADVTVNTTGTPRAEPIIYEMVRLQEGWSEPIIVARPDNVTQPALANGDGALHLAWQDGGAEGKKVSYTSQIQYQCASLPEGRLVEIAYDVARHTKFRATDASVPYCQNRYDRLLYTPGPPPTSSLAPTLNGGFDGLAELIREAEYEVLLSTMDYDGDHNDDSPGSLIASAVADLYSQLAADPSRYPRGLTVRILLGNPPPLETLELSSQLWHVLSDLRDAGVPEMVNPELGWRLEVANYEGAWPHSHTKILVIDGKTAVAAGFNMQYPHLAADHPSGRGQGTVDLALQMTGPVAQDSRTAFDELWRGAVQRHCSDLFPRLGPWQLSCRDSAATSDHVPEVMRYYLPGGESAALSMLRTARHDEADEQIVALLAAAEERIDIMHVQFSLRLVCNLNYVLDVCDSRHALPFVPSILDALEQNDAQLRLLVDLKPLKGIENAIALAILRDEVIARGLAERIEVRSFASPVHAKGTLIDDEFLIVGSQNYHWSAFGENRALAEYNLGTSDPRAVAEFQRFFDYYWRSTAPAE